MRVFSTEEVREATKKFFNGDELITAVWLNKYTLKNEEGMFVEKSPEDRFASIAEAIKSVDIEHGDEHYSETEYYEAMYNRIILPGGSGLYGIANPYSQSSLGNCFVISGNNEDSYGSILKNDQEIAQIAKRRGGVGLDISHLRPAGFPVANAAGSSTGAVSFMHRFSNTTREVGQEGRRN